MEKLTIASLAAAAGVNTESIRYYQRRALIEQPRKPRRGPRRYKATALSRVRFIKRMQQLGFTLNEVTGMLRLEERQSSRVACLLAEDTLASIEERIADLSRMRKMLKGVIAQAEQGQRPRFCPITSSLSATPK